MPIAPDRKALARLLEQCHAAIGDRASHGPEGDAACLLDTIIAWRIELTNLRAQIAAARDILDREDQCE